jgi:rRNA maturation protein Nop10
MNCPVCGDAAASIEPVNEGAVAVNCPTCGEWEASPPAAGAMRDFSSHQRMQALRFAQVGSRAGRRPFIHGLG